MSNCTFSMAALIKDGGVTDTTWRLRVQFLEGLVGSTYYTRSDYTYAPSLTTGILSFAAPYGQTLVIEGRGHPGFATRVTVVVPSQSTYDLALIADISISTPPATGGLLVTDGTSSFRAGTLNITGGSLTESPTGQANITITSASSFASLTGSPGDNTALASALALKATLASPTFTGTVTVPTPSNSTDAATKGYVDSNGGAVSSVFGRTGAVVVASNDYTWAQINKGTSSLADITTRSASDLSSGTLPDARFPATLPVASGVNLTALNASNLASGTVPLARLSGITTGQLDAAAGITSAQLAGSIANAKLANSAITINSTLVSLGGSISVGTVTHTGTLTANVLTKGNGGADITASGLTDDGTTLTYGGALAFGQSPNASGISTLGDVTTVGDWRPVTNGTTVVIDDSAELVTVSAPLTVNGAVTLTDELIFSNGQGEFTVSGAAIAPVFTFYHATLIGGDDSALVQVEGTAFSPSTNITTQRFNLFKASTIDDAQGDSPVVTTAATVAIAGPPTVTGTATITNPYSLWVQTGNVLFAGVVKAGSGPTTLTDSAGKVLSAALNTVAVAQGGSGLATLTAYALLAGGTTSTGNLQQVSGLGTSGFVLTSNGAGALPTWQAAGGSNPFDDGTAIIKGSGDATKLLRFEVDGFTTGTTRVITPPNADTIIAIATQQITWAGLTAARTITFPDAAITVARTDAANTFTGVQTFSSIPTASGLNSAAGVVLALTTTAATQTASTTAGLGLTLTADAAVAGSTNAGAAAGGAVTITGGDAKRLTSGNANGGSIALVPGAGIGTGTTGVIGIGGLTSSFPGLKVRPSTSQLEIITADNGGARGLLWLQSIYVQDTASVYSPAVYISSSSSTGTVSFPNNTVSGIFWSNSANDASQAKQTGIAQPTAGLVEINNGTAGTYRDLKLRDLFTNNASFLIRTTTTITGGGTSQVPTLTSGPVAGNPTKWIPVDDNGTTRYIPVW